MSYVFYKALIYTLNHYLCANQEVLKQILNKSLDISKNIETQA